VYQNERKGIMEDDRTLFRIKVHEHFSGRTRRGATSTGAFVLLIAVVVGLASFMGNRSFDYWMFKLFLLLSPFVAIGAIIYIVTSLVRPTRKVVCASCQRELNILGNARSFACPDCGQLLLLGKETTKQPAFSTCTYCGLETAICEDVGPYLCPDCGITLPQDSQRGDEQVTCPDCGSKIPWEAIYCITCDHILRSDIEILKEKLKDDLEWKAGKSPAGHYYHCKAIILSISNLFEGGDFEGCEKSPFDLLEEALVSLEEASIDQKVLKRCGSLLQQIDNVYRDLLAWELGVLNRMFSPTEQKDSSLPFQLPYKEEYIVARRRVEAIFRDALETFGSVGKWNDKLVMWEERKDVYGTPTDRYEVHESGYDGLKEEKARLDKWASERTASTNPS
jgi:predicted RNA-binding Zn-ribbon protein involved in translation (DUF1610 family)